MFFCLFALATLSNLACSGANDGSADVTKPPNILLVIADDLGYSDIGVYGGEIPTPNIDSLAAHGTLFTSFHTSPACATTRAMLFSGVDNHRAGLGTLAEIMTDEQRRRPGYEGYLNHRVASIGSVLKDSGYRTYYSGKWHLGAGDDQLPSARGFQRSFALHGGGGSHFDDRGFGQKYAVVHYTQDGQATALPADHYSSVTFTQKLLEFFGNGDAQSPFFGVLSFTAPHWPLQAPKQDIARHEKTYQVGWDTIRQQRFARMKELGLVPKGLDFPSRSKAAVDWNLLDAEERRRSARIMAVYAAMIELMDRNLGRVLAELGRTDQLSNTVVIFMSDNGADARDIAGYPFYAAWLRANFETDEPTGDADSFIFAGPGWGQVSVTPHSGAKSSLSEGGIRSPLIVADFRNTLAKEHRVTSITTVLDVVPTILDLVGSTANGIRYDGSEIFAPMGRSMYPALDGKQAQVHAESESIGFEYSGHAALIKGNWKVLRKKGATGDSAWALYDLENDQSEQIDLASEFPNRLNGMVGAYNRYAEEVGVYSRPVLDHRD